MKKYIYQVTAIVKANCTEYKYVVDVDADNQKEAVQTAKGMWDKVHHLFHIKARRLEAHEEALYCFWKEYEEEPQTKSKPEEAHVDIDEMNRATAPETAPAETETASETVSETATEADATEQATAKVYAVSFVVDGIAQANMAIAESAEAAEAYYNREYSGRGEVCAVREAAEWEITENRRRGMPFVTVPTEAVSEPETADEAANATDTADDNKDVAMTAQEITARKMIDEPAPDGAETETVELHDTIDAYRVCEENGIAWTRVNADTLAIRAEDYRKLLAGAKNKRYVRNLRRDTGRFCGGAFTLAG